MHQVLRQAFPGAEPWYDSDHVITRINGAFYDIRGEVQAIRHQPMDPLSFNRAYQWNSKVEAPESVKPRLRVEWQCEPHDAGWLVIAKVGDFALAREITRTEWREAHDQHWLFTSVVTTLSRNAHRLHSKEIAHG